MNQQELREAAVKRIRAKRGFWRLAGIFAIVWAILIGVWALSGGGYFWPVWAMFGMSIALLFVGWGAYGPQDQVTPEQVDAEVRRMREAG